MTEKVRGVPEYRKADDWDFDRARDAALREGLRLTPAERLAWLEETLEEMEDLVGRARESKPDR